MKRQRFTRIVTTLLLLLVSMHGVWGHISKNLRQGSGLVFSITPQGVEVLQPGTDARFPMNAATMQRLGNLFNRWRSYNPKVGRFISADPLGFWADINLYRYANDNPILYADRFGLLAPPETGIDPKNSCFFKSEWTTFRFTSVRPLPSGQVTRNDWYNFLQTWSANPPACTCPPAPANGTEIAITVDTKFYWPQEFPWIKLFPGGYNSYFDPLARAGNQPSFFIVPGTYLEIHPPVP